MKKSRHRNVDYPSFSRSYFTEVLTSPGAYAGDVATAFPYKVFHYRFNTAYARL